MPRYVLLVNWPDSGIEAAQSCDDMLTAAQKAFEEVGGSLPSIVHCVGDIDLVVIADAPTAEAMTSFMLALNSVGSARTVTLQAYSPEDMAKIVSDARAIREGYIRSGGEIVS